MTPIGSALSARIDRSSRKRVFITRMIFFRKTIAAKGCRALCQPPHPATMSVVREFYTNLIQVLTNGRGEWKINSKGHAVHFKAKHLAFIPKVWHHFITSRLVPTTNVCELIAKRALLNYAIIQDIPFDVGQVIEDAILHNRDAKMNLGHPFLIYGLCKRAGVPLDDNEAWLHPIKAISVKKDKPGVPRPEGVYDSRHEPSDEDDLQDYMARFGFLGISPGKHWAVLVPPTSTTTTAHHGGSSIQSLTRPRGPGALTY